MATNDLLVIVLIITTIITFSAYFIVKNNRKDRRISFLLKSHPELAKLLLDSEKVPPISMITMEQSSKILSLTDCEWEEWESLCKNVKILADKYPHALYDFISIFFSKFKDRVNYKKNITLFTPIPQKVKAAVISLYLEELRQIDADPESLWKTREEIILYAEKIQQKYPEGFKMYCDIYKIKSPKDSVVVNDKRYIAELQTIYEESKAYEGWEKKQEKFSSDFRHIIEDVCSQNGIYTYNVSFNKPTTKGTLVESQFKVWQGFRHSFSSYLVEEQDDKFKAKYDKILGFKRKTRYFYDRVYDQIFEIISQVNEKVSGEIYVILINQCKHNWTQMTYDFHYNHISEKIDESDIKRFNFSDLPLINDNGNIGGILILDFITSNEELMCNCKLIIEHFRKSVPVIGYYTLMKEYDVEELKKLAHKHEGYLCSEQKDIEFIKKCLLQIRKHSFFSYIAIPNTWIGEAGKAEETKALWLDRPEKYDFKTKDEVGCISGKYSIDGGQSYEEITIEGNRFDVNDTAKFTYILFKKMGVLSQFKKNGKRAVEYMNEQGLLAYH